MTTFDEPRLDHDARCAIWKGADVATGCTCRDDDGHTPRSWADGPMCAFDLETTGQDPLTARVVTATIVRIRPGAAPVVTEWLSDVDGEEIPDEAAAVHGVTTEKARAEGRPHAEVVREITTAIGLEWMANVPLVIYNAPYDLTLTATEVGRVGLTPFAVGGPVIDPLVLDRGLDRYRKGKRTLGAACDHYGVELGEAAHSSAADSLAAARVAWRISRRYPLVGEMNLAELQVWQAAKHLAWANGFGAYLRKNGKVDDVSRDWPIRVGETG